MAFPSWSSFCRKSVINNFAFLWHVWWVHGKTTYEWQMDDLRVHPMTYRWHTSTSEWYMDDILVYTFEIRMTYEYIRVTYKWHDMRMTFEWQTNDMCFKRKIKLSFLKLFENSLSKYVICRKNSLHVMAVLGYLIKLKWSLELSFSADFLLGFLVQILLI